jgi:SAM-dependent methyltransferase
MSSRHHTTRLFPGDKVDSTRAAIAPDRCRPQTSSEKWEKFAREDPYTYILTTLKGREIAEFWKSGERTIQEEFLPLLQVSDVRPLIGLELGCGVGRLLFPLARHFREIVGIDIATGMVQCATSLARDNGIQNVSFLSMSGPESLLERVGNYAGSCDFIYSLLVFQHIPELSAIEGYLHVIRILLHERGVAYLQFDTRPKSLAYRLKTQLPDLSLPRFWRRGIRRIRRSPQELTASMHRAGLKIVAEFTPQTAYHRYLLRVAQVGSNPK